MIACPAEAGQVELAAAFASEFEANLHAVSARLTPR